MENYENSETNDTYSSNQCEVPEIDAEIESEKVNAAQKNINVVDVTALEKLVRKNIYLSMGVGIVPVPLFDFAAVTAVQLNMVRQLSKLYGVPFKEGIAKKIIVSVTGAGAAVLASSFVEMAVAGIPLVGVPLAVSTKPMLNAMSTYAVSQMFITHFKSEGTFINANVGAMKSSFSKAYKNSREWLGNTISGKKSVENAAV